MAPTPRNCSTVCLSCWKTKVLFTSVVLSSVGPSASIFMAEASPAASILPSSGEELLAPPRVVMALSQNFMSWYERLELTGWDMIKACIESELKNWLDKSTGTLACIDRGKQKFWKTDRVNQKPFKKQLRPQQRAFCVFVATIDWAEESLEELAEGRVLVQIYRDTALSLVGIIHHGVKRAGTSWSWMTVQSTASSTARCWSSRRTWRTSWCPLSQPLDLLPFHEDLNLDLFRY